MERNNSSELKTGEYTSWPGRKEMALPFSYGVCDNIDQVLNYPCWKQTEMEPDIPIRSFLEESEKNYFISLYKINQNLQSKADGWRWCKWGKYIGKHDIQCEYLFDEDLSDIGQDFVYVFHIYEFKL